MKKLFMAFITLAAFVLLLFCITKINISVSDSRYQPLKAESSEVASGRTELADGIADPPFDVKPTQDAPDDSGRDAGESPASAIPTYEPKISDIEEELYGIYEANEAWQRAAKWLEAKPAVSPDLSSWDGTAWSFPLAEGASFEVDREIFIESDGSHGGAEYTIATIRLGSQERWEFGGFLRDGFREEFTIAISRDGKVAFCSYLLSARVDHNANRRIGVNTNDGTIVQGLQWKQENGQVKAGQTGWVKGKLVGWSEFPSVAIQGDTKLDQETIDKFAGVFSKWLVDVGIWK